MKLTFTEEKIAGEWDKFVTENNGDFLQSWNWGDLQKSEGSAVRRFSVYRNKNHISSFQAYEHKTRLGAYIYIPHGPVFTVEQRLSAEEQTEFADFLRKIFPDCIFILCEPLNDSDLSNFPVFNNLQPQKTLILDLTKPIEEIRKRIVYSRRQGMNFSEKNGVQISNSDSPEYFDIFTSLIKKTGTRQGFGIFDAGHYRNILKFMPSEVFVAKQENNNLAAAQVIFWENTATYLHAGSDDLNKKLRAPDLLIWKIIEESKNRGFQRFDFWGVDEKLWPGVTSFKKSFGGEEIQYGKARIIINNRLKFLIYNLYKKLRKVL